jgi:hypothetical protein
MLARVSATIVAATLLAGGTAWSACPPGQSHTPARNCVDLGGVPQISQEIVAGEHIAPPPKTAPPNDAQTPYTGPAVGVSKMIRRAPTVGYHWAID